MAWVWTPQYWDTQSKQGKFFRTSSFKAIKTALRAYNPKPADARVALTALKGILDAISEWRQRKQENKWGHTPEENKPSFAQTEATLRNQANLGQDDVFSVRSQVTDDLIDDVVKEVDALLAVERNTWGTQRFTDPANHDPNNFMYLVSAQTETKTPVAYREQTISNPALMKDAVISASVIKSADVHLWSPSGFVLSAPQKCIAASRNQDIGTQNIVALMHRVEKYRELLRTYLLYGIGRPEELTPNSALHHSEVVVLGRNYNEETEVSGVFVLVDRVSGDVAGIQPAGCWKVLKAYAKAGKPKQEVEMVPCVTAGRMQKYKELHRDIGLPIVQIQVDANTQINAKGLEDLYGPVRLHFDAKQMVMKA